MIKIVKIRGGLGNQMFGYAFYLMLKRRYPLNIFLIDPLDSWFVHNGYELPILFQSISPRKYKFFRRVRKFYTNNFTADFFKLVKENEKFWGTFDYKLILSPSVFAVYDGFWQSEMYFNSVKEIVRNTFVFNTKKLNTISSALLIEIKQRNSVSIHVRRCDYLEQNTNEYLGNICTVKYYKDAIDYILEHQNNIFLYFFSDDSFWVEQNLLIPNSTIISCNYGKDSWQDMCLMSYCKHNIIANSTFSWWAAWLNSNSEKSVIAPRIWMNNVDFTDIIPPNWIRL